MTATTETALIPRAPCDPAVAVTRSMLGYGVIAGPFYIAVSLTQALTRDGFDISRHSWSLLSNGSLGWIQITNFLVTGFMVIAGAVGVRRALGTGRAATWAPRLLAAFGVGMIGDAFLKADPMMGFPVGTPDGVGEVGWHGVAHRSPKRER